MNAMATVIDVILRNNCSSASCSKSFKHRKLGSLAYANYFSYVQRRFIQNTNKRTVVSNRHLIVKIMFDT